MEKETIKSTWSLEKAQEFAIDKFRSKQEEGTVTWELILEVLKIGVLTGHKFGAKWQAERMYSEEEVIELLQKYRLDLSSGKTANIGDTTKFWFEQFKKK
jgi:hypothetical protein